MKVQYVKLSKNLYPRNYINQSGNCTDIAESAMVVNAFTGDVDRERMISSSSSTLWTPRSVIAPCEYTKKNAAPTMANANGKVMDGRKNQGGRSPVSPSNKP